MSIRSLIVNRSGEARWTTLLGVVLLVAAAAWIESCARMSFFREAEGADVLKFSHKNHAQYVKDCSTCHLGGENGKEIVRTTHATCVSCHAAAVVDLTETTPRNASCKECHHSANVKTIRKAERPDYSQAAFDHADHGQTSCSVCHGNVEKTGMGGGINFPRMEDCLSCHEPGMAQVKSAQCSECHAGLLPTTIPKDHEQPAWKETIHGKTSMEDPVTCARCHDPATDCETCHSMERPQSHTAVFRAKTHGFHAMNNPESCQVCHTQEYCEMCHKTTEPLTHTASFKGKPYLHCVTCHLPLEEGNRCAVCHDGDPHKNVHALPPPADLIESGRIRLDEPCLPCHPVAEVPITHPYNTISPLECIECHNPP